MLPRSQTSTLFPYTTLFRSRDHHLGHHEYCHARHCSAHRAVHRTIDQEPRQYGKRTRKHRCEAGNRDVRSEEHTSELQSHSDLVCRLLLEKKKKTTITTYKR